MYSSMTSAASQSGSIEPCSMAETIERLSEGLTRHTMERERKGDRGRNEIGARGDQLRSPMRRLPLP
jgi:hypothetical protein